MKSVIIRLRRNNINFGSFCFADRLLIVHNNTGRPNNRHIPGSVFRTEIDNKLLTRRYNNSCFIIVVGPYTRLLIIRNISNLLIFKRFYTADITVCTELDSYSGTIKLVKSKCVHRAGNRHVIYLNIHSGRCSFIYGKVNRIKGIKHITSKVRILDIKSVMSFRCKRNGCGMHITIGLPICVVLKISGIIKYSSLRITGCYRCNNIFCIKVVLNDFDCCSSVFSVLIAIRVFRLREGHIYHRSCLINRELICFV